MGMFNYKYHFICIFKIILKISSNRSVLEGLTYIISKINILRKKVMLIHNFENDWKRKREKNLI